MYASGQVAAGVRNRSPRTCLSMLIDDGQERFPSAGGPGVRVLMQASALATGQIPMAFAVAMARALQDRMPTAAEGGWCSGAVASLAVASVGPLHPATRRHIWRQCVRSAVRGCSSCSLVGAHLGRPGACLGRDARLWGVMSIHAVKQGYRAHMERCAEPCG